MAKLLQCTNLTELNIEGNTGPSPGRLLPFNTNKFPFLRVLFATDCGLATEDLQAIANGCPNLEKLVITDNRKVRTDGVVALAKSLHKLEVLNLLSIPKLFDPALEALAECPSLQRIYMGTLRRVTTPGLSAFACGKSASTLTRLVCTLPPPLCRRNSVMM